MEPLEDWLADDAARPLPLRLSTDLSQPQEATTPSSGPRPWRSGRL
jgi:hypothetical protein